MGGVSVCVCVWLEMGRGRNHSVKEGHGSSKVRARRINLG